MSRFWDRVEGNARLLFMVAALVIVGVVGAVMLFGSDPADPGENDHARWCLDRGGEIQERSQFGGKWSTSTYWCTKDDQITDIWFGS